MMLTPATFATVLLALLSAQALAQNWTELQFPYDSLLNIPYGEAIDFNGNEVELQMDLFWPVCEEDEEPRVRPLIMWVHGGAFLGGSKDDASIQALCKSFAQRGYVTASINYRLGFVSDDSNWQCNFPEYSCVFAADSSEWERAYFRSVQDAKGALRYLVNRNEEYHIDTQNVFVAGESAGAFVALGVGLLDVPSEKPQGAFAQDPAPAPHPSTSTCVYNLGQVFDGNLIERPDLGSIEGDLEPIQTEFTLKGIGNMYGGMLSDLLAEIPEGKEKPAIYSFHQACDMVVPIDSNRVYWGLSWCFTNGYNCFGIANNESTIYGSRAFSNWNTDNAYAYLIQDEFTGPEFPFSYVFGEGSCLDQFDNPCHAYDSPAMREEQLAEFFANLVTTDSICGTGSGLASARQGENELKIYPNPTSHYLQLECTRGHMQLIRVRDHGGRIVLEEQLLGKRQHGLDVSGLPAGCYTVEVRHSNGETLRNMFIRVG